MTLTTDQPRASSGKTHQAEASPAMTSQQFEAIFLEHWPRIYRTLVQLVGDPDEAEDLALETFWRLYFHRPDKQRETKLAGWLYRVATHLGLNALRAWKRRQRYEAEAGLFDSVADPVESFAADEERSRVRQALGEMKPRQTQLLILRYSGLSYRELAEALNVSVNSVGALLVRAEREFEQRYRRLNPTGE